MMIFNQILFLNYKKIHMVCIKIINIFIVLLKQKLIDLKP